MILAVGVTSALVIIALGAAWHTGPISQEESSVLSTVLGAAVGAVAAFLGVRTLIAGGESRGDGPGGGGGGGGDDGAPPH